MRRVRWGSSTFSAICRTTGEEDLLRSLSNVTKVSPKEALEWEKELVGVYVSSHPLQTMTAELINVVTHSTAELTEELGPAAMVIAGMITDVRQITTKKGDADGLRAPGRSAGHDRSDRLSQAFPGDRQLWTTDKIVIVSGKTDVRNGRVSVLADSVRDYVEGMTIIEDTASVSYRYRNGELPGAPRVREGDAASRPAIRLARATRALGGGQAAYQAAAGNASRRRWRTCSLQPAASALLRGMRGRKMMRGGLSRRQQSLCRGRAGLAGRRTRGYRRGTGGGRLASRRRSCILGAGQYPAPGQRSDAGPQGRCAFLWALRGRSHSLPLRGRRASPLHLPVWPRHRAGSQRPAAFPGAPSPAVTLARRYPPRPLPAARPSPPGPVETAGSRQRRRLPIREPGKQRTAGRAGRELAVSTGRGRGRDHPGQPHAAPQFG